MILDKYEICKQCNGIGVIDDLGESVYCPSCIGLGKLARFKEVNEIGIGPYKWDIPIAPSVKTIRGKLIGKIPMQQIVIDEHNNLWKYEVIENKLQWHFFGHVLADA